MTATTGVQADHRELLLQAYAAYNSQDVEALVALRIVRMDIEGDSSFELFQVSKAERSPLVNGAAHAGAQQLRRPLTGAS